MSSKEELGEGVKDLHSYTLIVKGVACLTINSSVGSSRVS
jgi:hypothetical protein